MVGRYVNYEERKRHGVSQVVFRHCIEEISRFPFVIPTGQLRKSFALEQLLLQPTSWMHWLKFFVQITYRLGLSFGILTLGDNLGKRHV